MLKKVSVMNDLISQAVCSVKSRDCMMGICRLCPGEKGVLSFLDSLISPGDDGEDDERELRYMQYGSQQTDAHYGGPHLTFCLRF